MIQDLFELAEKLWLHWQSIVGWFSPQVQPLVTPLLALATVCLLAAAFYPYVPKVLSKRHAAKKTFAEDGGFGAPAERRFEQLGDLQSKYSDWYKQSRAWLRCIWNQKSMHPQGLVRALAIAFVYPISLLVLVWVATGSSSLGGSNSLLPEADWVLSRIVIATFFVVGIWFFATLSDKVDVAFGWSRLLWLVVALVSMIVAEVAFGSIIFVVAGVGGIVGFVRGAGSDAVVGAAAFSVAVTFIVSVILVWSGDGLVAFDIILIFAFAFAFAFAFEHLVSNHYAKPASKQLYAIVPLLLLAVAAVLIPQYVHIPFLGEVKKDAFSVNNSTFILAFFFTILPILNAISDWVSVSITQQLMRKIGAKKDHKLLKVRWVILKDLACAALLALGLLALVVFVIHAMAKVGWGIDPKKVVEDSGVWLGLMVLTNLTPTLLHLRCALLGWGSGRYIQAKQNLDDYETVLRQGGTLKTNEAQDLARYLYTYPVTAPLWLAGGALVAALLTIQGVVSLLQWMMVTLV